LGQTLSERPDLWVEIDVADRGPADAPLAATYTIHRPPGDLAFAAETGVAWGLDPATVLILERHPDDLASRVSTAEAGRSACRAQVLAGPSPSDDRTRRLRYTWIIEHPHPDLESSES
jgi:hypothetical protein